MSDFENLHPANKEGLELFLAHIDRQTDSLRRVREIVIDTAEEFDEEASREIMSRIVKINNDTAFMAHAYAAVVEASRMHQEINPN